MSDWIILVIMCTVPCFASGLALYRMAHHGQAIRRLARSTIPTITQSKELEAFNKQITDHFSAFQLCSFFSFFWAALAFFLLFLCSNGLSLTVSLTLYACYTIVAVLQSRAKKKEKAIVFKIVKHHPSFVRSELLGQLQALQKLHTEPAAKSAEDDSVSPPTFEKPTLKLKLGVLPTAASALSLAEDNMLKRAHQDAFSDSSLTVDEPMLAIFKDKEQTLRVLVSRAELVWQPSVDESGNVKSGRVFCAGVNFSGAKIAHFDALAWPETEVKAFTHAWISTKDSAHILLRTLWWLSDDQRTVIYELINPGQPYPIDWLPTAASRGSWQ